MKRVRMADHRPPSAFSKMEQPFETQGLGFVREEGEALLLRARRKRRTFAQDFLSFLLCFFGRFVACAMEGFATKAGQKAQRLEGATVA